MISRSRIRLSGDGDKNLKLSKESKLRVSSQFYKSWPKDNISDRDHFRSMLSVHPQESLVGYLPHLNFFFDLRFSLFTFFFRLKICFFDYILFSRRLISVHNKNRTFWVLEKICQFSKLFIFVDVFYDSSFLVFFHIASY